MKEQISRKNENISSQNFFEKIRTFSEKIVQSVQFKKNVTIQKKTHQNSIVNV